MVENNLVNGVIRLSNPSQEIFAGSIGRGISSMLLPPRCLLVDQGRLANQLKPHSRVFRNPETGDDFVLISPNVVESDISDIRSVYGRGLERTISQRHPYGQWLISMMLKGILPVVDIVPVRVQGKNGEEVHVASLMVDTRAVPEVGGLKQKEIEERRDVYRFTLRAIFNDYDHILHPDLPVNAVFDSGGHSVALYDFADGADLFFDDSKEEKNLSVPPELKESNVLRGIVEMLISRFSGIEGKKILTAMLNHVQEFMKDKNEPIFNGYSDAVTVERILGVLQRRVAAVASQLTPPIPVVGTQHLQEEA